ncbi:MAG: hypothetical protein HXS48_04490 [Theionarchaea archaeon]|nr:hypothetical protein [Theionarchaea archaeon]
MKLRDLVFKDKKAPVNATAHKKKKDEAIPLFSAMKPMAMGLKKAINPARPCKSPSAVPYHASGTPSTYTAVVGIHTV